jgi:hypothetical protein
MHYYTVGVYHINPLWLYGYLHVPASSTFRHSELPRSVRGVHICSLYGSRTTAIIIPLTGFYNPDSVFTARYELHF